MVADHKDWRERGVLLVCKDEETATAHGINETKEEDLSREKSLEVEDMRSTCVFRMSVKRAMQAVVFRDGDRGEDGESTMRRLKNIWVVKTNLDAVGYMYMMRSIRDIQQATRQILPLQSIPVLFRGKLWQYECGLVNRPHFAAAAVAISPGQSMKATRCLLQ